MVEAVVVVVVVVVVVYKVTVQCMTFQTLIKPRILYIYKNCNQFI